MESSLLDYTIANYKAEFEEQWLECLKEAFYASVYHDTILKFKPRYEKPISELITLHGGKIIGFLDIEFIPPTEQLCGTDEEYAGQITLIGVHPNYRRQKVASKLLEFAIDYIQRNNQIKRLEASFREENGLSNLFNSMNFIQCSKYFEVNFTQDFFIKYGVELPFGISPSTLSGFVDKEGFRQLSIDHGAEKTYPYVIMEKFL